MQPSHTPSTAARYTSVATLAAYAHDTDKHLLTAALYRHASQLITTLYRTDGSFLGAFGPYASEAEALRSLDGHLQSATHMRVRLYAHGKSPVLFDPVARFAGLAGAF